MNREDTAMSFCAVVRRALRVLSSRENAGVAAVEFAICGSVFLMAVAGTVDIGLLLYAEFQLDTAVNAGGQFAIDNAATVGSNPSALSSDILSIVNNLNSTGSNSVNVNNSNDGSGCYCPTGTPGNWSWGGTVGCGTACASGGGIGGQFVTITASRTVSPIFPTFGFVQNGTISRSVLVETQ
jgi:hypothetical protein